MARNARVTGIVLVVMLALAALPSASTQAQQARLCFAEVPDCIEGRFAEYWQQSGGLPVFGFPIGPARSERVGGGEFLVQPFERNRFELHPENARTYDVLSAGLGRIGWRSSAGRGRGSRRRRRRVRRAASTSARRSTWSATRSSATGAATG
jgi:hypothetical protein